MFHNKLSTIFLTVFVVLAGTYSEAQEFERTIPIPKRGRIEVTNNYGRVEIVASRTSQPKGSEASPPAELRFNLKASSISPVEPGWLSVTTTPSLTRVEVKPTDTKQQVDLRLSVPEYSSLKITTLKGEVLIAGPVLSAEVRTETGTIAADVPTENIRYLLRWTASRPRYVSDFELSKIKERSAGRFEIAGSYRERTDITGLTSESKQTGTRRGSTQPPDPNGHGSNDETEVTSNEAPSVINLKFETARGIILLNVPSGEVSNDLRERPLTNAARAIIRSGDSLLMEAIRRAAPRYYSDYLRTLPPLRTEPSFSERSRGIEPDAAATKVATIRVSDINNRSISGLAIDDFQVIEGGIQQDIVSVRPLETSFNLVLLLDVSGSIENYVDFIRKAARSFVNTVDSRDRVAIVTFGDDVHLVSTFSADKQELSESLDTFDAGGSTAYYDALAFVLADTLRPLRGERSAIVVLSDGDDNRSFLSFDSMLSSIQESGALIYPLYVPSGLIEATQSAVIPARDVDSLRKRYLHGELTSKAKSEGARLAEVSGGVFYQIDQLSQIDKAYEDIVRQLRTAYEIEYRSTSSNTDRGASPRLRVLSKRPNTFVQIRTVTSK